MSRDRRRRLSPSTREAKFGTGRGVRMTKRALLAIRCRRRNCCSALQPSQRSRAASLNAPGCQPMSASQVEPTSAMCGGDSQYPAHRSHLVQRLIRSHEFEDLGGIEPVSRANQGAAFFRELYTVVPKPLSLYGN